MIVLNIMRHAIKCLLNYEESKFSEEDNNLPDYRKFFVKMRDAEPDKYIKCYMYGNWFSER